MRTAQPLFVADRPLRRIHLLPLLLLILTALAGIPVAQPVFAQADAAKAPAKVAKKSAAHNRKHGKPTAAVEPQKATAAQPAPVLEAPKPDWPANNKPSPAAITWNASGLRIEASNSSVQQILKEVATLTGATVEGIDQDQRVFGVYGPGPAREVLGRLFDGSGYNMLLIGDQGQGTPRQILLTSRDGKSAVKAPKGSSEDEEDDVEQDDQQQEQPPQPPQPPLVRTFSPQGPGGNGPHTPQQMLQEMQQRQQQQ